MSIEGKNWSPDLAQEDFSSTTVEEVLEEINEKYFKMIPSRERDIKDRISHLQSDEKIHLLIGGKNFVVSKKKEGYVLKIEEI